MVADFDSLSCALAHGAVEAAPDGRALVAVFASPVATHLLHLAATLGYRVALAAPAADSSPAHEPAEPPSGGSADRAAPTDPTDPAHQPDEAGPTDFTHQPDEAHQPGEAHRAAKA